MSGVPAEDIPAVLAAIVLGVGLMLVLWTMGRKK